MLKHDLYVFVMHYMAHCTNLLVQTLNNLSLGSNAYSSTHNYFAHFPKRHFELIEFVELMQCKGNKIF
jgi:hypothetical protein